MDTGDAPRSRQDEQRSPTPSGRRHFRLLLVAGVALTGIAAAALVGVSTGSGQNSGDEDAVMAGSAAEDEAAEAAAHQKALAEAERIAAEQSERTDALVAAQRAAEEAAAEEAEAERLAEEEAAEAERRAEQEAAEAAEAAARAEREAAEQQMALREAQERLVELGYLVGAADGQPGQQTTSALMAFQAVNGLSVDGALGPQTMGALESPPRQPQLRGGPATRIEVDMDLQVLHLVEGGQRVTTMNVSTGRGGSFETESGETLYAETPVGTFTIDRRIQGEHKSSYGLGSMWDPMYFHGPWAIHGSPNVPAGPASAGCVRVALADGTWLFNRVPNGTPVVLYGGTHVFTP